MLIERNQSPGRGLGGHIGGLGAILGLVATAADFVVRCSAESYQCAYYSASCLPRIIVFSSAARLRWMGRMVMISDLAEEDLGVRNVRSIYLTAPGEDFAGTASENRLL